MQFHQAFESDFQQARNPGPRSTPADSFARAALELASDPGYPEGVIRSTRIAEVPRLPALWAAALLGAALLLTQSASAQTPKAAALPHLPIETEQARELAAARAQLENLHLEQQRACSSVKRPDCEAKTKALTERKPALEKRIAELSPTPIHLTPTAPLTAAPITLPTAAPTNDPITAPVGHHCFIATAAFGSPMADEVVELRRFRDQRLAGTTLGNKFIATYYAISPPIADAIASRPLVRSMVRGALRVLLVVLRDPVKSLLILGVALALPLWQRRGRRVREEPHVAGRRGRQLAT